MPEAALLHCPIRGQLKTTQRAADGLTFTEEKRRIDSIRFLLRRDYPKENFGIETTLLRFGNQGRNSFRIDYSVYEVPFEEVRGLKLEDRLEAIRVVGEIKRSNDDAEEAVATQVKPALGLLPDLDALGVYWDDVEQRFFYRTVEGKRTKIHEAPLSKIPAWGSSVSSTRLTYADLEPPKNLVQVFDKLEDALHPHVADKSKRYQILLQLLLAKIHDENLHAARPSAVLDFQDFSVEAVTDKLVVQRMDEALSKALDHYQQYLPEKIEAKFRVPSEALRRATQLLAPIKILGSRHQVIQAFYMKFAKNLYKWDLAQYFTPHEVIDFIVRVTNPQYGEHVKDPACGSADFLISTFRAVPGSQQCLWGSDNSEQAAQISVLNMVLNGDGKTNITREDSLEVFSEKHKKFSLVLCNPPFGTKILEKRFEVLKKFDLGYEWVEDADGRVARTDDVRTSQQTGILFAELCVRMAKPGGRVGIILPNGYLGNRSTQYLALREWLLRHARLAGVVAFPRFTFKKAGADVSASVVFLEKRATPLARASDSKKTPFFVGMVESVGWRAGDKKAVPIYVRDPETGANVLDEDNEPILDADFDAVFNDIMRSAATDVFDWLSTEREIPSGAQGWHVPIEAVACRSDLSIDPKRHCYKFVKLREEIMSGDHFKLGDVLSLAPVRKFSPKSSEFYKYVEIGDCHSGDFDYHLLRGWQLPDRAKLLAVPGDIFIAHIWGSAGTWFIAPEQCENLVATSGFTRLRLKKGQEDRMVDLVAGLCSEAFRVQMRGFATGSDGLADVAFEDLAEVVLPKIGPKTQRQRMASYVDSFLRSDARLSKAVEMVMESMPEYPAPDDRKSHCSLV